MSGNMRTKIDNDRNLIIPLWDFIEEVCGGLSPEHLMKLMDSLSCSDAIIKNVADQIIDGCTDMGSWGSGGCSPEEPNTPLDIAKRRIAKAANDIADGEIYRLEQALKHEKEQRRKTEQWAWAMYHAWPKDYWQSQPQWESYR